MSSGITILDEIFASKQAEIERLKPQRAKLERLAADAPAPLGFRIALASAEAKPALIAEVKKASPSAGVIRADFRPVEIAQTYVLAGANALSVLTDELYFGGHLDYLRQIRSTVSIPLLRKDFIADELQILEARATGADALLLIVAGLEQTMLARLYAFAKQLSLDVLVEVHDAEEVQRAVDIGADLIGINNRDLRTFQTNLALTAELMPLIPKNVVRVSESALHSNEDVVFVASHGADAVLIGTAFTGDPDVAGAVQRIMGRGPSA